MVDVHSHLIYGVDDGVKTLEESMKMILAAKENGYQTLVVTPHYIEDSIYSSSSIENSKIILKIEEELLRQNIDVKICLGNEFMLSNNVLELLEKNEIKTLNNSKYLLTELSQTMSSDYIIDKIDLLISKNIIPIIAHPERYDFIDLQQYKEMVSHGALLQMNLGSLLGTYGKHVKKRARLLIKNNLIYIVGSDTHRKDNFSYLLKTKKIVSKLMPNIVDDIFYNNPIKILEDN